jgi:hypothetical protein
MYVGVAWIFNASYPISGSVTFACPLFYLKLKFLGFAVYLTMLEYVHSIDRAPNLNT